MTDADQDARKPLEEDAPTTASDEASKAADNDGNAVEKQDEEAVEKPEPSSDGESADPTDSAADSQGRDRGLLLWAAGIVAILAVELFIYGHDGRVEVCVGLEGVTDFSLVGQQRTGENFRKYPKCLERMNLGMWTSSEDVAREALDTICSRLTAKLGAETKQQCLRKDGRWDRVVVKENIPPWDPRLYRQLLFLD